MDKNMESEMETCVIPGLLTAYQCSGNIAEVPEQQPSLSGSPYLNPKP